MIRNKDNGSESAPETETESESAPAPSVKSAVSRAVEAWIDQNLRNTAFSRDTEAWNTLQGALPKLAPMIDEEIQK